MGNLREVITVVVLGALILGVILGAGCTGLMKEDETPVATNDGLVPEGGIPAIDTVVPVRTETATFALG